MDCKSFLVLFSKGFKNRKRTKGRPQKGNDSPPVPPGSPIVPSVNVFVNPIGHYGIWVLMMALNSNVSNLNMIKSSSKSSSHSLTFET